MKGFDNKKIPQCCFLCENSIPDHEYGYACGSNMWEYFCCKSKSCPKYKLDKKFAIQEGIKFFKSNFCMKMLEDVSHNSNESYCEKVIFCLLAAELFENVMKQGGNNDNSTII